MAQRKPERHLTYADCRGWPEDVRGEIIDGAFYDMAPGPSLNHQALQVFLASKLFAYLDGKPCRVLASPTDVILPGVDVGERDELRGDAIEESDNIVQPDVFVYCDSKQEIPQGILGAPKLVIEILAPSTVKKDLLYKRDLYELHGVEEYWIVDPLTQEIDQLMRLDGKYTIATHAKGSIESTSLPGFVLALAELFANVRTHASS